MMLNSILRRMFGPMREVLQGESGEKCIMRSIIICALKGTKLMWENND